MDIYETLTSDIKINMAFGYPGPEPFQHKKISELSHKFINQEGEAVLQYSPATGLSYVKETVKNFLINKGIKINDEEELILTPGGTSSIYYTFFSLLNNKDFIITESPTFVGALNTIRFIKANILPIDIDIDGINVYALEEKLKQAIENRKKVKAIYLNPTAHNPTGVIMSDERRKHLIEIANKYDLLIIEDDPYGFFVFDTDKRFTSLKTLDTEGRVIYMGTFSKILAPGLRLGYIVANKAITDAIESLITMTAINPSTLSQFIAMYAIKEGVVDETIENARKVYRKKRDVLIEALEEYMPKGSEWYKPKGGLFAFVYLPKGVDTTEMLPTAINKGVAYVPGRNFFADGSGGNAMRINFSYPSIDKLREGIKIIGETAKEMMKH
ncbi:transcriptional regulator with HTH domain and aminotransferase domain [Caldisphaera lagunensis DSM 15908]|uniref:Transcriptional regulator with HTH domain and aminotransferase domain n=1 Tax=Caldisphaera lagunensis (strain DSM 15908 / JCM 11604 / ANMR 0165 / IC-154) TaxID=1056495 RepID=L0A978_CALLD|nr:PLP-dependent aminotransferase family protein [Caldisphaera lagunensis]AFZ70453.1 transcriptional regulator with HTH domain and aminotransferase domain [Caldisphaera lagunensis DSM 15908]